MTAAQIFTAVTSSAHTPQTREQGVAANAGIAGLSAVRPHDGKSQAILTVDHMPASNSGPGQWPSTRSEQFHARVVASSLRREVRKTRVWNTARASASHRPVTVCEAPPPLVPPRKLQRRAGGKNWPFVSQRGSRPKKCSGQPVPNSWIFSVNRRGIFHE
jgi:hypothetical protein